MVGARTVCGDTLRGAGIFPYMDREKIIQDILNDGLIEDTVRNVARVSVLNNELLDLVQDVYMLLLTYDECKLRHLHETGAMRFFIARVVINQYRSRTSPFYGRYRRFADRSDHIDVLEVYDGNAD